MEPGDLTLTIEDYRKQLADVRTPAGVMMYLNGGLPRVRCTDAERRQLMDETLARRDQVDPEPAVA